MTGRAHRPAKAALDRGGFYRLCRMLHAYLSAFAFLTLVFFSITGLMLNHPDWFPNQRREAPPVTVTLESALVKAALASPDPPRALAAAVEERAKVTGAYHSGDVIDQEAVLRWEGPRGSTDAEIDLAGGSTRVTAQPAPFATLVGDLHKGKNSGAPWRLLIDVSAALVIALSIIGYVLFFSLRFRLRTSLILTAASLAVMLAVYYVLVP